MLQPFSYHHSRPCVTYDGYDTWVIYARCDRQRQDVQRRRGTLGEGAATQAGGQSPHDRTGRLYGEAVLARKIVEEDKLKGDVVLGDALGRPVDLRLCARVCELSQFELR